MVDLWTLYYLFFTQFIIILNSTELSSTDNLNKWHRIHWLTQNCHEEEDKSTETIKSTIPHFVQEKICTILLETQVSKTNKLNFHSLLVLIAGLSLPCIENVFFSFIKVYHSCRATNYHHYPPSRFRLFNFKEKMGLFIQTKKRYYRNE